MVMDVDMIFPDEAWKFITERMNEGWVVLLNGTDKRDRVGRQPSGIIEDEIYTPGTEKNKFFELVIVFTTRGRLMPVFLCKITDDFKSFFNHVDDIGDTLCFIIHDIVEHKHSDDFSIGFTTEQIYRGRDYTLGESIDRFVTRLRASVEDVDG